MVDWLLLQSAGVSLVITLMWFAKEAGIAGLLELRDSINCGYWCRSLCC